MLKIGEFSKLSRISIRMLRHYDEIHLLTPAETDSFTGYRYYTVDQILTAGQITALKDMGFGLSAIRTMIGCQGDALLQERYLLLKRAELQKQSEQTAYRLRLLDSALVRLRKENHVNYNISLKTFPLRYAATVRMTIPSYEQEGMLWSTLMSETAALNLVEDDPCYCCAVFHDKEFKETDVDVEVQKTVKGPYPDTEHVLFRELPPVTVASVVFKGSYGQINEVYAAVAQWIEDNGYDYDGAMFNIYHVSPHETRNPDEYVTEVCYPVRK